MATGLMFDDIDLKAAYGFVTSNVSGRGLPPVQREVLDFPGLPGAEVLYQKWGARNLSLQGYVFDRSSSAALTKARNVLKLFSSAFAADKKLGFPDTGQALFVRLASAGEITQYLPIGPLYNAHIYEIQTMFTAYNPFFFDMDLTPDYVPQNLINHGSFENDSNNDGLADGWQQDTLSRTFLHDPYIGDHSQRVYLNNTFGEAKTIGVYQTGVPVNPGTTVFVAGYMRLSPGNTSTNSPYIKIGAGTFSASTTATVGNSWGRIYMKAEIPFTVTNVRLDVSMLVAPSTIGTFLLDGVSVYDLVALGLQDQSAAALDALLPYTGMDG